MLASLVETINEHIKLHTSTHCRAFPVPLARYSRVTHIDLICLDELYVRGKYVYSRSLSEVEVANRKSAWVKYGMHTIPSEFMQ